MSAPVALLLLALACRSTPPPPTEPASLALNGKYTVAEALSYVALLTQEPYLLERHARWTPRSITFISLDPFPPALLDEALDFSLRAGDFTVDRGRSPFVVRQGQRSPETGDRATLIFRPDASDPDLDGAMARMAGYEGTWMRIEPEGFVLFNHSEERVKDLVAELGQGLPFDEIGRERELHMPAAALPHEALAAVRKSDDAVPFGTRKVRLPADEGDGYRLSRMERGTLPRQLGYRSGDVLVSLDDVPITQPELWWRAMRTLDGSAEVRVELLRHDVRTTLVFEGAPEGP